MTSKHIKRFLSMIAIMFVSIGNVYADDIKIAELNWQSGSMIANIDAYILTHGYGHDVEIIPGGIDATIQSMMATGSPNIFGEAWTSLLGDSAHKLADQAYWQESQRNVPGVFEGGYAFVALIGPEGQLRSDEFKVGLFIQQPDTYYPPHAHDAEEFYFLLSGKPKWRAGKRTFTAGPGDLIHHAPSEVHSMETMNDPFLAIWSWIGDLNGNFWFPDDPSRCAPPSES